MTKDWTGNKNSIYKCLGASNHTEEERETNDYYATDPSAIDDLLKHEKFNNKIWECAVGEGHLDARLEELGHHVIASDLHRYATRCVTACKARHTHQGLLYEGGIQGS